MGELFRVVCSTFCFNNYLEDAGTSVIIPPLSIHNSVVDLPKQNLCLKTEIIQFINNQLDLSMPEDFKNDSIKNNSAFTTKEILLYSPCHRNEKFLDFFDLKCCVYNKNFQSKIDKKREKSINKAFSRKTIGEIDNITNYFGHNIDYTLLCAADFSGYWKIGFNKEKTELDLFTADGKKNKIEMMNQKETFLYYEIPGHYKSILLPYTDDNYQFMVILPENEFEFSKLQSEFNVPEKLNKIVRNCSPHFINLKMPKFTIDKVFNMETYVVKIEGYQYNLNTVDRKNLKIIHKAKFKIDEVGTNSEETGTKSINYSHNSNFYKKKNFFMNKPFLFYVLKNVSESLNRTHYVSILTGTYLGPEN